MDYAAEFNQLLVWFNGLDTASLLGLLLTLSGFGILLLGLQRKKIKAPLLPYKQKEKAKVEKKSSAPRLSDSETIAALQQRLDWQNTAISLLGQRILALEEYLEMVGSRQQALETEHRDQKFYREAIRMVDAGATTAELAEQCGISASEADLLSALYRKTG